MRLEDRISGFLEVATAACNDWIEPKVGGYLQFVDPHDGVEISAHYGASHFAAVQLIVGRVRNDINSYENGVQLLRSVLDTWNENIQLKEFHFDFNTFALCVAEEYLNDDNEELRHCIRRVVIQTADSNHETVNWLPMRMYVNKKRFEWTGKEKFQKNAEHCGKLISLATNSDGGIEDSLPKGVSYNLQYNVATVALLQFVNCRGGDFEISGELGFLLDKVLPDGDINYQGRGANQIFAWGMWIYLLSSTGRTHELEQALDFLTEKLDIAMRNKNIMLNEWAGEEKYLWWDYHYCSVYTAHFAFWLSLALKDYCAKPIAPVFSDKCTTGLSIKSNSKFHSVSFEGRNHYLAEKGPLLSALWLESYGTVFKSTMGPWLGQFGNKYLVEEVVLRNFLGLIAVNTNYNFQGNFLLKRISRFFKVQPYTTVSPVFSEHTINVHDQEFTVTFINRGEKKVMFNLPLLNRPGGETPEIKLLLDGRPSTLRCNLKIRNQYDWCNLYQSEVSTALEWKLVVK